MIKTRNFNALRLILGVGMLLLGGLTVQTAFAECQPGQMQEANLAYQSAAQFLAAQQWDQAIARLNSIVNVCPEHVEATRGLGTAYMGKGDYATAVSWFSKVPALRGDQAEAGDYANTAKAFAKQKLYKEARAEYMKAEQLAPDDCGVLFNLGVMHYAAGVYTQSVDVLEHCLDACPQYRDNILPQLSKSAGKAAEQQRKAGNASKAQFYQDLMTQYGGAAGGSTTYDMVKKKMTERKYDEAVALLEQMLGQNPDQPNAWLTLARARDAAGNKGGSVEAYLKYIEAKPNEAKAVGAMLQVMVEDGRCSEANSAAQAATARLVSQGARALAPITFSWGMALECLGDLELAKAKFSQVVNSGNDRYTAPARTNMQRMDDLADVEEYKRKKARQGG